MHTGDGAGGGQTGLVAARAALEEVLHHGALRLPRRLHLCGVRRVGFSGTCARCRLCGRLRPIPPLCAFGFRLPGLGLGWGWRATPGLSLRFRVGGGGLPQGYPSAFGLGVEGYLRAIHAVEIAERVLDRRAAVLLVELPDALAVAHLEVPVPCRRLAFRV